MSLCIRCPTVQGLQRAVFSFGVMSRRRHHGGRRKTLAAWIGVNTASSIASVLGFFFLDQDLVLSLWAALLVVDEEQQASNAGRMRQQGKPFLDESFAFSYEASPAAWVRWISLLSPACPEHDDLLSLPDGLPSLHMASTPALFVLLTGRVPNHPCACRQHVHTHTDHAWICG